MLSRRNWLLTASLAAAAPLTGLDRLQPAARPGRTEPGFRIKHIQRTTVALPYRPVPARNMARELPHWVYSEICEVEGQWNSRVWRDHAVLHLGCHQR